MMEVTSIALCTEPTPRALTNTIDEVLNSGARSLLFLAADKDAWEPKTINPLLSAITVPLLGAIFPSILLKKQQIDQGTLVIGLSIDLPIIVIEQLSADESSLYKQLEQHTSTLNSAKALFTFFDGISNHVEQLTEGLYDLTGVHSDTVGCGAGFHDFIQRPCIFTNNGLVEDAAIIAALPNALTCGFSHGWQIIDGPCLVTQSKGNILESINYQPAYDHYQQCIEKHSGLNFEEHDFFSIAQTYPLGISSIDGDIVVRNPIQSHNTSLICVGDVPKNATIYLLKGESNKLIDAAKSAAIFAEEAFSKKQVQHKPAFTFIIDCISRESFLGEKFSKELSAINDHLKHPQEVFGALTIGEVCNTKNGPIELLNKSTVVAII